MPNLRGLIEAALPEAVAFRHDLHRHPELGYQEFRTSERVQDRLRVAGIEFQAGLAKGTGIVGFLPATANPTEARTVALRADMDALPIVERTDLPYRSEHEGRMHACGHDGHTTILVTAARLLAQLPERPQNVVFLFQPAEEGGAGGKRMVAEGAIDRADITYGLHGFPAHEVGKVSVRNGPMMAAATQFSIRIRGKGSHAAYPHLSIDPIVVGAHIITALQTIASRTVSPLDSVVVTVGRVKAGVAHNVIPEEAVLDGTLRTLSDQTAEVARTRVAQIAEHTAAAFGAVAETTWATDPYPVTWNHPEAADRVRAIAGDTVGSANLLEEIEPSMAAEDFSFYGREKPACFFFLGIRPVGQPTYPNLHAPTFDFNDDALLPGIETMINLALRG